MVFVWSNLCDGEPHFTLSQVALNDLIMVFLFAPLVGLLLGVASITVPWSTLLLSVALYIVIPVIIAQAWRRSLLKQGAEALAETQRKLGPASLVALLTTLVLLFGFQGQQIIAQPTVIMLLAVPILIQVYFNSALAYWLSRKFGVAWCVAAPSALIGASNFFELAVAAAISLFGLNSGAALATVVGVLVEVPVMLSVVKIVKATRGWYEFGLSGTCSRRKRSGEHRYSSQPRVRNVAKRHCDRRSGRLRADNHGISENRLEPPAASGAARRRWPHAAHRTSDQQVASGGARSHRPFRQ